MADLKISQLTGASTPLAGTEVLPIVQSGSTVKVSVANLTAGRAVGMAGGSFTDNITQSTAAKGVNFTANTPAAGMTSQLLNWYEEGTFTATLTAATPPTTPPTTTARYTRIGRQVTVSMEFDAVNTSGASGAMKITGLPFTPASTAVSTYLSFQLALGGYPIAVIFSADSTIYFYYTASNADWAAQPITAGAGKYLYLSLTYTV